MAELKRITPIWMHYIRENHSSKGCMEIARAIQLNLSGELSTRIESYGRFGLSYISSIMIQYDIYRAELIKELDRRVQPKQLEAPQTANGGQMHKATIEYCNRTGEWPMIWPWTEIYQYMDKQGLIKMTLEDKKRFYTNTKASIYRYSGERESDYQDRIRRECHKRAVKRYIFTNPENIKEPAWQL